MDKLDIWKVDWNDVVIKWGEREESKKRPGFRTSSHWCGGRGRTGFKTYCL